MSIIEFVGTTAVPKFDHGWRQLQSPDGAGFTLTTVDAFRRDENDDIVWLPMASDLAGFNSTRFSFYGGKAAIDAGLVLLPTLRDASPLWVSGSDLELLRREVLTLRTLVPSDAIEYWEFRLNNILRAIDEAEKYGAAGGVCIG